MCCSASTHSTSTSQLHESRASQPEGHTIEGAPSCGVPCTLDAHGRSRIFNVGPGFGSGLILANLQLQNADPPYVSVRELN